ncbi:MAG TPA: GlsB/YeaQ/YmgE family stress response membrane protein [Chloroflexia bacterium]|nr:GlsB/YeaQ/YmgE family stress response membrane protein [Chloroflexia bacterium]
MTISLNFTIPDPLQLLVYLVIGLIVALLVGSLAHLRPGGYLGTFILAVLGAWIFASILQIQVVGDVAIQHVPIIEALIGALLFGLVGALLFRPRADVVVYDE